MRDVLVSLYAFLRRQGKSVHDAEDLSRGLLSRFPQKSYLETVDSGKGKFRSYLPGALEHLLANERDRALAGKWRGGRPLMSLDLDVESAEPRFAMEPHDDMASEALLEKSWVLALNDGPNIPGSPDCD